MNFSEALTELKNGKKLHRVGWNGRGLFVQVQRPTTKDSKFQNPFLTIDAKALGGELNPWVPSVTDLFADDWQVLETVKDQEKGEQ